MSFLSFFKNLPAEHWHPLMTHFPIALWSIGVLLYLLSFVAKLRFLVFPALLNGMLGSLFGFFTMQSGEKALDILEKAQICEIKLPHEHEEAAETAFIFLGVSFAALSVLHLLKARFFSSKEIPIWLRGVLSLGLILGSVYLLLAGHYGYRLVYLNGLGVTPLSCK